MTLLIAKAGRGTNVGLLISGLTLSHVGYRASDRQNPQRPALTGQAFHGFNTATCVFLKSPSLRETTVRLNCRAVAVRRPSMTASGVPLRFASAARSPTYQRPLSQSTKSAPRSVLSTQLRAMSPSESAVCLGQGVRCPFGLLPCLRLQR